MTARKAGTEIGKRPIKNTIRKIPGEATSDVIASRVANSNLPGKLTS
jgi:hypothetical protein